MNKFKILAFESSCDDTSVSVIDSDYSVLSNVTSSQPQHADFGGVVPELASRLHMKNIMPLTRAAMKEAKVSFNDIDAVAVSVNPGLIGALLVGVSFAKSLAYSLNKPLIAVNHMLGHIAAVKIEHRDIKPPYVALVVSGGHTELVWFKSEKEFEIIGRTRDDAAGEAFDKTAKLLKLGYPGGPVIDKLAQRGNPEYYRFPRAMNRKDNFDFSFSGLKTSVFNFVNKLSPEEREKHIADIAASAQEAITDSLSRKASAAVAAKKADTLIVAGGVSANSGLRKKLLKLSKKHKYKFYCPSLKFCMDNAAMIGAAAINKYKNKEFAELNLNAFSTKGVRFI
ncbi:MAG: tRNA (adenosine(37)-N6)-threonylcarbamoyltransferase complex transferase subunit TsaD [Candidatus Cloacimonadota bacterium]|nr:MAG: tRNA (adenosine(37)-N6)-threonylcarbamoyltransferase complex transferase subunit TsaD [Candidatus Cloacimonadota bacterium]